MFRDQDTTTILRQKYIHKMFLVVEVAVLKIALPWLQVVIILSLGPGQYYIKPTFADVPAYLL